MSAAAGQVIADVEGRTLALSNLNKVLYPQVGLTKGGVIDYYLRIAPVLLPHVAGRPLTFIRYPDGVTGKFFYAKNAPAHRPDWVPTALLESPGSARPEQQVRYVVGGDLPTLIWAANLAGIEIHAPMWRLPRPGEPDTIVFDLDPGPPATIVQCCQAAALLRPLLADRGLDPVAKTSGKSGLQLYAAVTGMTCEQASGLAREVARVAERSHPGLVVSQMKRSLRTGRVLIDWSQNNGAKTTAVPYTLRAMATPTVSTPVTWAEVSGCASGAELAFTCDQVLDRVASMGDLFAPLLRPGA